VVQVDEERDALAELPSTSVGQRASASGMCYIIFTSGSTGRPKGAVLQHDSAVNFLHFINRCAHSGGWQ
jgi:long-subunit acyl-CoA synthetase (AMP-forming)